MCYWKKCASLSSHPSTGKILTSTPSLWSAKASCLNQYNMHVPLYISVSEKLRKRIATEFASHQEDWALPTLLDLAKEYKTSLVTAKKAVDRLSLEGLTYARSGVGIKVSYKTVKDRGLHLANLVIGVIFLDIFERNSLVIGDIIHGIVDIQQELGFQFAVTAIPSQQSTANQISVLDNILDRGVDGLIVASRMPIGVISRLQVKGIKFVWVNNTIPHEKIYSVMFNKSAMYLKIIKRIKSLGFKKAAWIAPVASREDGNLFANLCASAEISLKLSTCDTLKRPEDLQQIAVEDTLNLLSAAEKPEVIVCNGEMSTAGALKAIFSKGLKVPDDIHIITISEQEGLQSRTFVPIDTMVQSFADVARESTLMLHAILKGDIPESHIKYLPVNDLVPHNQADLLHLE